MSRLMSTGVGTDYNRSAAPYTEVRRKPQTGARPVKGAVATTSTQASLQNPVGGLIAFCMALFIVALFYVWSNAQVVRSTYALSRLNAQQKEFMVNNEKLRLEIATLRSPASISRRAQEQLKLVAPEPQQAVIIQGPSGH